MQGKKTFQDIDTSAFTSKKVNPFAKKTKVSAHKTIRIYEEDYKELKSLAFYAESTIVEMVHEAVQLLKDKNNE